MGFYCVSYDFSFSTNNITTTQGLYNGNIRHTTNQIQGFAAISYVYNYDQLNRLAGMTSHAISGNSWSFEATATRYRETVTYDANGNIRTYWRNQETGDPLDKLTYNYDATKKNRLLSVKDAADPSAFADDVEGTESFEYDAIGNLTKQTKKPNPNDPTQTTELTWNAYGKVRQVTTSTATMTFGYDAQQNRLKKTVATSSGTKTTYYIRDAQGNALAVYEQNGASLVWKEQDLYGSSRLGMAKPEREVTGYFWASAAYTLVAGAKSYELSNHLGNVMAVISDRGELQSAQDFYPFGMAMPGRSTDAKHRYGFNSKETDPETGIQDYGMRWYLPNLGRFPSVDPITKKYPELTPYQFAGNTPIQAIDLDGLEPALVALLKYTTTSTHVDADGNITSTHEVPTYQYTAATSHFLSLLTGIPETEIRKVELRSAGTGFTKIPNYDPVTSGGGLTFPGETSNTYQINLSDNYFNATYGSNNANNDAKRWLRLSAHEVGHIRDIKELSQGLLPTFNYFSTFADGYIAAGGHDDYWREQRAEAGSTQYDKFAEFVGEYYCGLKGTAALNAGSAKINALFTNPHNTEKDVIGKLDKWWAKFQQEKPQKPQSTPETEAEPIPTDNLGF